MSDHTHLIPRTGLIAWHKYDAATSTNGNINDASGNGLHVVQASNPPVLTPNAWRGRPGWVFDGSANPLATASSSNLVPKHIFMIAAVHEAVFSTPRGLLSGKTTGDWLTTRKNGSDFYTFGSGYDYWKNDVAYADNHWAAPTGLIPAVIEVQNASGVTINGIQIGQQKSNTARKFRGIFFEAIYGSAIWSEEERQNFFEYAAVMFNIWRQDDQLRDVWPFDPDWARPLAADKRVLSSTSISGVTKSRTKSDKQVGIEASFTSRDADEYDAALAFWESKYPGTDFVFRDRGFTPSRDTVVQLISGLNMQQPNHNDISYGWQAIESIQETEEEEDLSSPPVNWAALSMGGKVYANRSFLESRPEQAFDGVRHTNSNWAPNDVDGGSGGWDSGADEAVPAVIIRDFEAERTFSHLRDYTIRDAFDYSDEPAESEGTTLYGNTSYAIDAWAGSDIEFQEFLSSDPTFATPSKWLEYISFTDSYKVTRFSDFPDITTSKLRFRGYGTADHPTTPHARLAELEAHSRNPLSTGPLESLQRKIIRNQWPAGLPTEGATSFTPNGGPSATFTESGDSDLLTFDVFPGLTLNGYFYTPKDTPPEGGVIRDAVIINIHGHETIADGIYRTEFLVDRGFHVLVLGMPNYEPNASTWDYAHSMNGNTTINKIAEHSQYESVIENDGTRILPLFLDQVFRAANWIRENYPAMRIHLTGHSGGGFMCSIAAALDDRRYFTVKNSSAGELPFALDDTTLDVEQRPDRPWWQGHDWPELYQIAARFGKFTKSHSEQDPAFSAFQRHHVLRGIAEAVNAAIAGKYPGRCALYIDPFSMAHAYTELLLEKFVEDCLDFEAGLYPPLDLVTTPVWAAYGSEELLSTYDGPIFRVRDSLDVEVDISLVGTPGSRTPDSDALTGNGPYRIVKMYDHFGLRGPMVPIGNDLTRAPYLNETDMRPRFVGTGDPNPTGFQLPDMSDLTEVELFIKRILEDDPTLPADGFGGWLKMGTAAQPSHSPYDDQDFYDGTGSTTRRDSIANSAPLDVLHVMHAWSAANDWGFGIDGEILETDSSNTVGCPAVPKVGTADDAWATYGKGEMEALVIFSQKCTELDRNSVIAAL